MAQITQGTVANLGLAGQWLWVSVGNRTLRALATTNISSRRVTVMIDDRGKITISDPNAARPVLPPRTERFHQGQRKKPEREKDYIQASAVFTVERPTDTCRFPQLEMNHRTNLVTDDWDWFGSAPVLDFLHTKDFYFWNGKTTSLIFSYTLAEEIQRGETAIPVKDDLTPGSPNEFHVFYSDVWPEGAYSPIQVSVINEDPAYYYCVVFTHSGFPEIVSGFIPIVISESSIPVTDSGLSPTNFYDGSLEIGFYQIGSNHTAGGTIDFKALKKDDGAHQLKWQVYRVPTYSNYFTATEKGVVFAHWVNSYEGDPNAVIKYYSGTGTQPPRLTETPSLPSWDWRGNLVLNAASLNSDYETTAFYADYYGSATFNLKLKQGITTDVNTEDPDLTSPGRMIQRMFGYDPDTQSPGTVDPLVPTMERYRIGGYNPSPGRWDTTTTENSTYTLPTIAMPTGFTGVIQDLCIPPVWSSNAAQGTFWQLPYLQVLPYRA